MIGVGTAVPSGPTVCTIAAGWYAPSAVYAGRAYASGPPAGTGGPPGAGTMGYWTGGGGGGPWMARAGGWRQYGPPVYEQMWWRFGWPHLPQRYLR